MVGVLYPLPDVAGHIAEALGGIALALATHGPGGGAATAVATGIGRGAGIYHCAVARRFLVTPGVVLFLAPAPRRIQ